MVSTHAISVVSELTAKAVCIPSLRCWKLVHRRGCGRVRQNSLRAFYCRRRRVSKITTVHRQSDVHWTSVGVLYLWSAERIRKGEHNGFEGALGGVSFSIDHSARGLTFFI
jgi:hypothetical protein